MSELWAASLIVLWIVVLALLFLVAGALRLIGLLQLRLGTDPGALITESGLDRGQPAPPFEAEELLTGRSATLGSLGPGRKFLAFLSPGCYSCEEFAAHLNEVASTRADEFKFAAVCRGDRDSCLSFVRRTKLRIPVFLDQTGLIEQVFEIALTPFAYLLDEGEHVLVRGVATTWSQLESLLAQEGTPGTAVRTVEVEHRASSVDGRPA